MFVGLLVVQVLTWGVKREDNKGPKKKKSGKGDLDSNGLRLTESVFWDDLTGLAYQRTSHGN